MAPIRSSDLAITYTTKPPLRWSRAQATAWLTEQPVSERRAETAGGVPVELCLSAPSFISSLYEDKLPQWATWRPGTWPGSGYGRDRAARGGHGGRLRHLDPAGSAAAGDA